MDSPRKIYRVNKAQSKACQRQASFLELDNSNKFSTRDPWVEYWNLQRGLVTHKPNSAVYWKSAKAARELLSGLSPRRWDVEWLEKNKIPNHLLEGRWRPEEVKRSIRMVSSMTEPGNWPGPSSWLTRLSFYKVIYDDRTCTSVLLLASRYKYPPKMKGYLDDLSWENADESTRSIASPMLEAGIEIALITAKKIAQQYNLLCADDPLVFHLSGGFGGFGRILTRWLLERNITKPGTHLSPPSGKFWKQFLSTFQTSEE